MSVACGKENLLEIREKHRDLFYRQEWFTRESFMRILPDDATPAPPTKVTGLGKVPKSDAGLPRAVDLAHAFVADPTNPIWENWIWCADKDANGQRVFVGVVNGQFEIHRHLAVTKRWGVACWV